MGPLELPFCMTCGADQELTFKTETRTRVPGWVWIIVLLALLPGLIVALIVQAKHKFVVVACRKCVRRKRWSAVFMVCAFFVILALMCMGIAIAVDQKSWLIGIAFSVVALGIGVVAIKIDKRANPVFPVFTKERLEVQVPNRGRWLLAYNYKPCAPVLVPQAPCDSPASAVMPPQ